MQLPLSSGKEVSLVLYRNFLFNRCRLNRNNRKLSHLDLLCHMSDSSNTHHCLVFPHHLERCDNGASHYASSIFVHSRLLILFWETEWSMEVSSYHLFEAFLCCNSYVFFVLVLGPIKKKTTWPMKVVRWFVENGCIIFPKLKKVFDQKEDFSNFFRLNWKIEINLVY